jgi:hypothetical protein
MYDFDDWLKLALDTSGYQGMTVSKVNKYFVWLHDNGKMDDATLTFLQLVLFSI